MQLFSIPQQIHASRIKSDPIENLRLERSSNERRIQDAVMNKIPAHNLGLIFSLKIINAIIAVATISKLLRKTHRQYFFKVNTGWNVPIY